MAKEDEWLLGWFKEVEKEPSREEEKERDQGKRVREEGECEHGAEKSEVVDAEVGEVLADSK